MSKLTNWQKFDNAFKSVSAFVVLDQDTMQPIAKIALKYPSDGAGRLNAYIHIIGMEVQHGYAGGYGYDKSTASIIRAICKCNETSTCITNKVKITCWTQVSKFNFFLTGSDLSNNRWNNSSSTLSWPISIERSSNS